MALEVLIADRQLAYQRQVGSPDHPGIVFLGGFASDMQGSKALFLSERCAANNISFVRFDYSGCGQSPGSFAEGTMSAWLDDSLAVLDRLTQGPQIIVGSSMGGWLGLLLAKMRPARAKAYIGIAAAPDFTEDLVWDKLTGAQRETLLREGQIYEDDAPEDHRIPLTLALIEDARQHLVLRTQISIPCPMRLLHGMKDREVPAPFAQRIADHVNQDDVRAILIKNGDHRLSTPADLTLLWHTISEFV
jgi:pimeloyl-ACP methyl ester carboxylesterase